MTPELKALLLEYSDNYGYLQRAIRDEAEKNTSVRFTEKDDDLFSDTYDRWISSSIIRDSAYARYRGVEKKLAKYIEKELK